MGALELVMASIVVLMGYLTVKKVGFNYYVVGQSLDVLGIPGVQDRLFRNTNNVALMQQVVDRYSFLTKVFPVIAIGVFVLCVALYTSLRGSMISGEAVSMEWVGFCSLVIGGALAWLITFEPTPDWLYESHTMVLLTKSKMDLEVILAALNEIESNLIEGLSEDDVNSINLQCAMLSGLASDVEDTVQILEQQKREIIDNT